MITPTVRIVRLDKRNWGIQRRPANAPPDDGWVTRAYYSELDDALRRVAVKHLEHAVEALGVAQIDELRGAWTAALDRAVEELARARLQYVMACGTASDAGDADEEDAGDGE